jgi:hypothetical protein
MVTKGWPTSPPDWILTVFKGRELKDIFKSPLKSIFKNKSLINKNTLFNRGLDFLVDSDTFEDSIYGFFWGFCRSKTYQGNQAG